MVLNSSRVYATEKILFLYLALLSLLLISLFMMTYDGVSKYLLLLATKRDSVTAGLETVPRLMAVGACGEARNAEGTVLDKQSGSVNSLRVFDCIL